MIIHSESFAIDKKALFCLFVRNFGIPKNCMFCKFVSSICNTVLSTGSPTKNTFTINSEAVVTSITPSAGSTHGGLMVNISGNGFSGASDTSVDVDGSPCEVSIYSVRWGCRVECLYQVLMHIMSVF